jgi:hypothetical protein
MFHFFKFKWHSVLTLAGKVKQLNTLRFLDLVAVAPVAPGILHIVVKNELSGSSNQNSPSKVYSWTGQYQPYFIIYPVFFVTTQV